jgi:hypothetical protein
MATQVQFRRGTTTQNNAFTGAIGEITYDTDIKTLRLHDGTNAGGGAIVATTTASQTLLNKVLSTGSSWEGGVIDLAYGGTGAALTADAGGIVYSTADAMGISSPGASGQVLTSGGTNAPTWVNASSLTVGTSTVATTASNIEGGSSGYLVYQVSEDNTGFIAPGQSGYILRSTGASTAPNWVTSALTIGTTALQVGDTEDTFDGIDQLNATGTSHWTLPAGTTAERPGTPADGMVRYNSTISSFEGYGPGGAWGSLGGVKDVDQDTYLLTETSAGSDEDTFSFYNAGVLTATLNGTTLNSKVAVDFDTTLNVDGNTTLGGTLGVTGAATLSSDLTVQGNLTVSGTTTTVNTETINLADNIITLNSNETGTPSQNGGFEIERGTSTNVSIRWNESTDIWEFTNDGTTYSPIADSADVRGYLSASDGITYNSSTGAFTLTDTGVTAASYGSASQVPVITVNANGQITAASTVAVAGVTDFDYNASTGVLDIDTADGQNFATTVTLGPFDTGDLVEGSNLYYLDSRARAAVSATDNGGFGALSYSSSTGVISYTGISTEEIQDVVGAMVSSNSESGISVTYQDADGTLDFNVNDPTITLTGAVTGSATMTNLGNVSIATTATADPTLTINGDASGSATFTNLGNATLTLTIADDSHNHTTSNIDNFTESVQDIAGGMWSSNSESGVSVTYQDADGTLDINVNDPTITLTGDVSGSATMTNLGNVSITATVANDSHTHDGRYYTETEADARFVQFSANGTFTGTPTFTNGLILSGAPFIESAPTVTSNYTITTSYNTASIGPITVASGVTVTVSSGAIWSIL